METVELDPTTESESVLVFPAYLIEQVDFSNHIVTDQLLVDTIFHEILESGELFYVNRELAEENPDLKQLIPYTVIRRGKEVFRYKRTKKGGESRLHDKWSVGVGGHVNPVDGEDVNAYYTYYAAFWRELGEEVGVPADSEGFSLNPVALLYDDSDDVGLVHFGVVHQIKVPFNRPLEAKDEAISDGRWQHPTELRRDVAAFEKWSQLVINNLF